MGIIWKFIILFFLILITFSIMGLLWSFLKKRAKRPWVIRLIINLFFFIGTAVAYNNQLLVTEQNRNNEQQQNQQRIAETSDEINSKFQDFSAPRLAILEQNIIETTHSHRLIQAQDEFKAKMAIMNAKIDYLTKQLSQLLKQKS